MRHEDTTKVVVLVTKGAYESVHIRRGQEGEEDAVHLPGLPHHLG